MPIEGEATRGDPRQRCDASRDFEQAVAASTVEMVVVRLAMELIPRDFTKKFDLGEPPLVEQASDVSIDGRNAEAAHLASCSVEHLGRAQGAIGALEHATNRAALSGITFHRGGASEEWVASP